MPCPIYERRLQFILALCCRNDGSDPRYSPRFYNAALAFDLRELGGLLGAW